MNKLKANNLALHSRRFCIKELKCKNIFFVNNKPLHQCKSRELDAEYINQFGVGYMKSYLDKREETSKPSILKINSCDIKSYVYFFVNEKHGFCKIGKSINPHKRICEVQTGCPFPILIAAIMEGNETEEKLLHKKFKHLKSNGEWFFYRGDLVEYVKFINSLKS